MDGENNPNRLPMKSFHSSEFDSSGLKALLFDMGDVLYDATLWRRWVLQVLRRFGLVTNYQAFFRVWESEYLEPVNLGKADFWETFATFLRSAGLPTTAINEVITAAEPRRRLLQRGLRPLPGVPETCAQLSQAGVRLATISNNEQSSDTLRERLRWCQAGRHFEGVFPSCEIGAVMPDEAAYSAVLEGLNLTVNQVAFVGHDTCELAGAKAAGMRTIAVNNEPDAVADYYLDNFADLTQLLEEQQVLRAA